ncbi:MAG: hypothetical protein HZC28_04365 [Spirochaetes bacterium]|nr:hypothetical protein [Spirochaetota bacterium]
MPDTINPIAQALGFTTSNNLKMNGTVNGISVTGYFQYPEKAAAAAFTLTAAIPCPASFTIRKEKKSDVFFRKTGFVKELTSGDAVFDALCYIDTYDNEFTSQYISDRNRRETIRSLFAVLPGISLKVTRKETAVSIRPCTPDSISASQVQAIIELMPKLTQGVLSLPRLNDNRAKIIDGAFIVTAAVACTVGILALCIGAIRYTVDDLSFAGTGALIGVAVFAAFSIIAFFAVRGRSSSPRVFLIVALLGLFGFPSGGAGIPILINCATDSGRALEYVMPVTGLSRTSGKSGTSYYIHTGHWKKQTGLTWLRVHRSTFSNTRVGDRVILSIKPGAWGHEWIESYRMVK